MKYALHVPDEEARSQRRRYLAATLVTCVVAAMVGGAIHVVMLGANRMADMRAKAGYDLAQEHERIRAAGEEIQRQDEHEFAGTARIGYSIDEVDQFFPVELWRELDSTVTIPEGSFVMGTNRLRANDESKPEHKVFLPAYRIDKYLVTNAQYARFVSRSDHRPPLHWQNGRIPDARERHPVTMVSWYDAAAYCKWANKRLPTEAEWEKAARGTDDRTWPWGNEMQVTRLNAYYNVGTTTAVDHYPNGASPFGVLDMAGNVNQWVADNFEPYEGTSAPAELFQGKIAVAGTPADQAMKVVDLIAVEAKYKVLRGGSWKSDPFSTASYHRNYSWPHYASDFFGFRCAQDAEPAASTSNERGSP